MYKRLADFLAGRLAKSRSFGCQTDFNLIQRRCRDQVLGRRLAHPAVRSLERPARLPPFAEGAWR
jgi:hypothetical protein